MWHQRFGHKSHERICDAISNNKMRGINLKLEELNEVHPLCEPCVELKMSRKPIPKAISSKANDVLVLVYSKYRAVLWCLMPLILNSLLLYSPPFSVLRALILFPLSFVKSYK